MPYIKRDDAINKVLTLRKYSANDEEKNAYSLVYKTLRELPTADVVEVVRCEKCLHANETGTICRYGVGRAVEPTHFCSYGKTKERGGEK